GPHRRRAVRGHSPRSSASQSLGVVAVAPASLFAPIDPTPRPGRVAEGRWRAAGSRHRISLQVRQRKNESRGAGSKIGQGEALATLNRPEVSRWTPHVKTESDPK